MSADNRHKAPFAEGDWVTPTARTHPMHGKRGKVLAVEYSGQGVTDQFTVVVVFDNPPPNLRTEWTFRHQDLTVSPAAQVASPYRDK